MLRLNKNSRTADWGCWFRCLCHRISTGIDMWYRADTALVVACNTPSTLFPNGYATAIAEALLFFLPWGKSPPTCMGTTNKGLFPKLMRSQSQSSYRNKHHVIFTMICLQCSASSFLYRNPWNHHFERRNTGTTPWYVRTIWIANRSRRLSPVAIKINSILS